MRCFGGRRAWQAGGRWLQEEGVMSRVTIRVRRQAGPPVTKTEQHR